MPNIPSNFFRLKNVSMCVYNWRIITHSRVKSAIIILSWRDNAKNCHPAKHFLKQLKINSFQVYTDYPMDTWLSCQKRNSVMCTSVNQVAVSRYYSHCRTADCANENARKNTFHLIITRKIKNTMARGSYYQHCTCVIERGSRYNDNIGWRNIFPVLRTSTFLPELTRRFFRLVFDFSSLNRAPGLRLKKSNNGNWPTVRQLPSCSSKAVVCH